jgi:CBS domain-containing protein
MLVSEVLKDKGSKVFTIHPDRNVKDVTAELYEQKIGAAVVVDAWGKVVGILSERDIVYGIAKHGEPALDMRIDELMAAPAPICGPEDRLTDIMATMTHRRVRHIVVMVDGKLRGIVSIGDLVKYRLAEIQLEVGVLRDYARVSHP